MTDLKALLITGTVKSEAVDFVPSRAAPVFFLEALAQLGAERQERGGRCPTDPLHIRLGKSRTGLIVTKSQGS